jgi:hypothetical protein
MGRKIQGSERAEAGWEVFCHPKINGLSRQKGKGGFRYYSSHMLIVGSGRRWWQPHETLCFSIGLGEATARREMGRFGCVGDPGQTAPLYRIASTTSSRILADWFA